MEMEISPIVQIAFLNQQMDFMKKQVLIYMNQTLFLENQVKSLTDELDQLRGQDEDENKEPIVVTGE